MVTVSIGARYALAFSYMFIYPENAVEAFWNLTSHAPHNFFYA